MFPPVGHVTHHRDRAVIALAAVIGVVLTGFAWDAARRYDVAAREASLTREVESRHALISETLAGYEESLLAFKLLFTFGRPVDRQEFAAAARIQLDRHPGFLGLQWAPLVTSAERDDWEKQNSSDLGPLGRIRDRTRGGGEIPSPARSAYYPLLYVEPYAANRQVVGSDAAASPLRADIERALATDKLQFSGLVKLAFESGPNDGIVLTCPVHSPAPHESGIILGVFRVADLLTQPWRRAPATRLDVLFLDETATRPDRRLLFCYLADGQPRPTMTEADFTAQPHRSMTLTLANRTWRILYRTSQFAAPTPTHGPLLILLGGFALTALGSTYLAARLQRSHFVETQVRERTAELTENRRQLAALMHALPGMAYRFRYDTEATLLYLSEGAFALTGWSAEALLAGTTRFRDCLHADDIDRVRQVTRAALAERRDFEIEYRIVARDGSVKWVLSRGRGVFTPDGRLDFVEGLAIDITAQKHAETERLTLERRLLEGQKLESLGVLAGGIAHDFNNLLTTMLGNAELARLTVLPETAAANHLERIEQAAHRAADLCRQMLAYAGKRPLVTRTVCLSETIASTAELLSVSLPKNTTVDLRLARDLPGVIADATQLQQIAMNLLLNAADAIGREPGTITVTTFARDADAAFLRTALHAPELAPGCYVGLEVTDTGCGMTPETMARIFEPFFTTKFSGRGLGLAAVLGIVQSHRGALFVESTPGQGSTFRLLFPASPAPSVPGDGASDRRPAAPPPQHTVLIVDDDASVRQYAADALTARGLAVLTAGSGDEALQLYLRQSAAPDTVLLDLTMPGLPGDETLRRLLLLNPTQRILVMSGYGEPDTIRHCEALGASDFIAKPFELATLLEKFPLRA